MKNDSIRNSKELHDPVTTQMIEQDLSSVSSDLSRADSTVGEDNADDYGPPVEEDDELKKRWQRRRRVALLFVTTLLFMALALVVLVYRRSSTRVNYGRVTPTAELLPPTPGVASNNGRDSRTEKAIEEAQRLTTKEGTGDTPSPKLAFTPSEPSSREGAESPFKFPSDSSTTMNSTSQTTSQVGNAEQKRELGTSVGSASERSLEIHSERNSETSLYMNEPTVNRVIGEQSTSKNSAQVIPPPPVKKSEEVLAPAFASMLPVRTIGALYTLRTGSLVRLELTRETKGDGWSMKRGTILVGLAKGSDGDRAYMNLIGFIEPASGRLVKLGGELLGSDGGVGIKGKRRKVDGGWTKALNGFVASALELTGSILSGNSRNTVVVTDGLRTRTINPVTEELSGVLGSQPDQSKSFVEVVAGTSAYILVTDLPSTIEAKEPSSGLNADSLSSFTDVDTTRSATGLSDHEMADLLSNGSAEQIRAAMPRMSPAMRRIAEAVVRP
ncbi:MAG TPA: hypothetical protein VI306_09095 [Pyrinomonadaceae bacterium]